MYVLPNRKIRNYGVMSEMYVYVRCRNCGSEMILKRIKNYDEMFKFMAEISMKEEHVIECSKCLRKTYFNYCNTKAKREPLHILFKISLYAFWCLAFSIPFLIFIQDISLFSIIILGFVIILSFIGIIIGEKIDEYDEKLVMEYNKMNEIVNEDMKRMVIENEK